MELTAREGEHGRLTLRGRLADGGGGIRVTAEEGVGGKEKTLFQGAVLETHIFVENGVRQIILSAESSDGKMDRKKRSRSFQDTRQTYVQIIRDILSEYGGTLQCETPSVKIGKPVIYCSQVRKRCRVLSTEELKNYINSEIRTKLGQYEVTSHL